MNSLESEHVGDAFERARELLNETSRPASWIFEDDGPEIIGRYVRIDVVETNDESRRVLVLKTADGRPRSVWFENWSECRRQVELQRFEAGQTVAIRKGKKRPQKNDPTRTFVPFDVVVVGGDGNDVTVREGNRDDSHGDVEF